MNYNPEKQKMKIKNMKKNEYKKHEIMVQDYAEHHLRFTCSMCYKPMDSTPTGTLYSHWIYAQ